MSRSLTGGGHSVTLIVSPVLGKRKGTVAGEVICWEALDPDDPALAGARRLYETAIDAAERIPWAWLESAVRGRHEWRPGAWAPHLLLAGERGGPVAALAYGAHVPDFGGYACYLAVEARRRRHGLGS